MMKGYLQKKGRVWYTTVDLPRERGGKRRQKQIRLGPGSKRDAQMRERQVLSDMESYTAVQAGDTSVAEFLTRWLADIEPTATWGPVTAKTHERYTSIVRNQLIPHLGHVRLDRLNAGLIIDMQSKLKERGLSGRTLLHVYRVLHAALNFAYKRRKLIRANPATDVPAPRASGRVFQVSESDVIKVLEATRGTKLGMPVLVAVMTGLRRGELLALKWQGVNFERSRLVVSESVEETKRFGIRLKPPKSGKVRVIPLADDLLEPLRAHQRQQARLKEERGCGYEDQDLIFCNDDGSIWQPDWLTHQFASTMKAIGMKGFRLHDLRHCFGTIALKDGAPLKEVSEMLGHSSPVVTLSIYAHTMEGAGKDAVNRLARTLQIDARTTHLVRKCEKLGLMS
jgi:integrase